MRLFEVSSFFIRYQYYILALILLSTFILKIFYVFYMTDYPNYLFSDLAGYWDRALERQNGDIFNVNQWVIWPTFPHILLSWVFDLISLFKMEDYRLEIVLVINIILSTIAVGLLYFISYKLFNRVGFAFIVSIAYALYYPLIYFNAFILSEHIGIFTSILSLFLVIYYPNKRSIILLAGVILALGVAARPAMGLFGLPFFLYVVFANRFSFSSFLKGAFFSIGFFTVIAAIFIENNYISDGKVKTFSANGGLTFYFSQCKTHRVDSQADGINYYIVPPSTVQKPENGVLVTSHPFYDQDYFFDKGMQCIKDNPMIWWDNLKKFEMLFFGPLLPSMSSANYFPTLLPIFQHLSLGATFALGLLLLLYRDIRINRSILLLLLSIPILSFLTMYFFNTEQRYFYSMWFSINILSILVLYLVLENYKQIYKQVLIYIFFIVMIFVSYEIYLFFKPQNIYMQVFQNSKTITSIYQEREIKSQKEYHLDSIFFETSENLYHATRGSFGKFNNVFIDFKVNMMLNHDENVEFLIVSDDGFILFIDEIKVASFSSERSAKLTNQSIKLKKGSHQLKLSYFQGAGDMAIKLFYKIDSKRYLVGESSEYIQWSLSNEKR